jgi:hypothetical protein
MYCFAPGDVAPYAVARLGFSLIHDGNADYEGSADLEGGLVFAIGGGAKFADNMKAEMTYEVNKGEYGSADVDYKRLRLSWGMSF